MKTRILVAIPLIILVALAMLVQGWVLAVLAIIMGLFAQFEVVRALRTSASRPIWSVSMTFAALLAILFAADYSVPVWGSVRFLSMELLMLLLCFGTMAAFVCAMLSRSQTFGGACTTVFTLVYPALFLASFYLIILSAKGYADERACYIVTLVSLLVLFIPPVLSDTVAYFWGSKYGKRNLAPIISPKKTVEGSIAGVVGGAIGGLIAYLVGLAFCQGQYDIYGGPFLYLLMGAILAVLSQFGDLAASYLKRAVGLKDYGKLLPGHGGVMDRIDSTMFVMPIVYMFMRIPWITLAI